MTNEDHYQWFKVGDRLTITNFTYSDGPCFIQRLYNPNAKENKIGHYTKRLGKFKVKK